MTAVLIIGFFHFFSSPDCDLSSFYRRRFLLTLRLPLYKTLEYAGLFFFFFLCIEAGQLNKFLGHVFLNCASVPVTGCTYCWRALWSAPTKPEPPWSAGGQSAPQSALLWSGAAGPELRGGLQEVTGWLQVVTGSFLCMNEEGGKDCSFI